jgi:hypothetical protein
MATYRVWFSNDSARLVTASSPEEALQVARELAELDATDLKLEYQSAKAGNPDRAKELAHEWLGCTLVKKVESLA